MEKVENNGEEAKSEEKQQRVIEALVKNGLNPEKNKEIVINENKTLAIINGEKVISLVTGQEAIIGEDGIWDWIDTDVDKKEVGICGYNGSDENITIPEYVIYNKEIYTVTALKNCSAGHDTFNLKSPNTETDHMFKSNKTIKSITILGNITTIDGAEFLGNSSIENITMNNSVQTFTGESVFQDCTNLKRCVLSDEIKIIPSNMFQNCTSLEYVNIPKSATEIGAYAFSAVKSLEKVSIPQNVKKIGMSAFSETGNGENTRLREIIINEGVEEIGEKAFYNATNVKYDLRLPSTVTKEKIGKNAFAHFGKRVYLFDGTEISTKWED